jgi:hypothetical protein
MKIYYAHHLWKYNTPIEEYEIELIRKTFPGATIINPNTDIQQNQEEAQIMADCIASVETCDVVVFSSMDGVIGKGVFDEVAKAKTVYYIFADKIAPFNGEMKIIPQSGTRRLYATVAGL